MFKLQMSDVKLHIYTHHCSFSIKANRQKVPLKRTFSSLVACLAHFLIIGSSSGADMSYFAVLTLCSNMVKLASVSVNEVL